MEQYQHNGRKLIQMLFKNTEKGASAGPPVMTLPTKPTHAHPPSKLFPPVVSVPPSSRIGPETPTSPDPPSPLQWTPPHSTGPRFALVKPTKKVKRAPARIPPLDVAPSTPGPSRHSNNHAEADLASATEGGNPAPVLESDLDILAADDVTVEDMNRVIDDLKQWRADHAHKMATQFSGASSSSQSTDDDDATARQLAAMEAEDDADHKELMQLYEQAKARWSTSSRPKDWGISTKGPPPTPEGGAGDMHNKIQAMLASPSTTENVEKLQQLRHEVFELHVKDISRQLHRQMDLNNDDDAFDAHLLELELGVQTYANDLDILLHRLDAYSSTITDENNESDH